MEYPCLLCLDNCDSQQQLEPTSKSKICTLTNYLQIPWENGNSEIISDQINPNTTESHIFLCTECEILLETFQGLLKLLEIAKLKVDSCVQQIRDVMLEGNSFSGCESDEFKRRSLRRNIIRRTEKEVQKSQPNIGLLRNQFITSHLTELESPLEPKLEIKTEPDEIDVGNMEVELGVPFSGIKCESTETTIAGTGTTEKTEWECCHCNSSPEGDPPALYYSVKCLIAQTTEIKIPHFMCSSCKRTAEESTTFPYHKMCLKCGDNGAWRPDDLRRVQIPNSLVRNLKAEKDMEKEMSKEEIYNSSELGRVQRQLVHMAY